MRAAGVIIAKKTFTVADGLATIIAALTEADGVPLDDARGIACSVVAGVGNTITGGNMRFVFFGPTDLVVTDNALPQTSPVWRRFTLNDFAPTTGQRVADSSDMESFNSFGRGIWVPDALTLSAGTTVDVITYARKRTQFR